MSLGAWIGAGLLGVAAWLGFAKSAQAAAPAGDLPPSDPVVQDSAPVAAGPLAYLAIVRQLNDELYGGFFDPALVMGVMQQESAFNPMAYRYEASRGEASYGLMQLLYSTARDRGFSGDPAGLYDPATNIALGMAQLKWSFDYLASRLGTVTEAQWLSSYNAGVGYVLRGGNRYGYVASVQSYRDAWRGVA
ncbi:MAG TPA: lytic transglycosylase domain-containing protein [Ferrovibrio sp.]|uniref:lytic transglycosylase domain-containing protein n=1 Tax=Ferrovibrio sp. TaxID=1917215 RepID=UPI002ED394F2